MKRKLAAIGPSLPEGLRIEPFYDRSILVNRTVHTVAKNLAEGALLVVLVLFLLLFMTAGVGNASTFKMIPVIFLNQSLGRAQRAGTSVEAARRAGTLEASAILGFSSAIGAYGGFIIPIAFGNAIKSGTPQSALAWFLAFYASCLGLTWWFYYRRRAEAPC